MPVRLPLPYIRQFGSKCFAGGSLHSRGAVFQGTGLTGTGISGNSPGASRTLSGRVAGSRCHFMFKTPERKEFPSRPGGTLANNRPTLFDARRSQMVSRKRTFSAKSSGIWRLGKCTAPRHRVAVPGHRERCNRGRRKSRIEKIHGDGPSNSLDWKGEFREVSRPGKRRACGVQLCGSQPSDGIMAISTSRGLSKNLEFVISYQSPHRRGGRAAECGGLLNRFRG
jgi:hypothetical protein